jgi:hypothetical protein
MAANRERHGTPREESTPTGFGAESETFAPENPYEIHHGTRVTTSIIIAKPISATQWWSP